MDILAPGGYINTTGGVKIRSTTPTTINNGKEYALGHETSYATPHVSATIAMMKSLNYDLTPAQILTRLKNRGNKHSSGFIELDTGESVRLTSDEKV